MSIRPSTFVNLVSDLETGENSILVLVAARFGGSQFAVKKRRIRRGKEHLLGSEIAPGTQVFLACKILNCWSLKV